MKAVLMIALLLVFGDLFSQERTADEMIRAGNEYYKQQQFAKASEEYTRAMAADPAGTTPKFNQANALYKQDKKVESAKLFAEIASTITDQGIRSKAFYNKGVILSEQKNLEESIEAYKNALRNDPTDKEARENLQKALLELKKKNAEKKKEDDQQKKKKEEPKKQQQPKMKPKEAEQRLKLLQQKEKEVQQRVQKEKTKTGGSQAKDW
ncbi:MAG: tetratricopeptide repeat protein [Bacteroidota bacterium]|nr:tetratricopeptide repeat protein [Bacteroidota bacterium]